MSESKRVQDRRQTITRCRSQGVGGIYGWSWHRGYRYLLRLRVDVMTSTRSSRYLLAEIQVNRQCLSTERGTEEIRQGICRLK